jgi:hypothetical protein
VDVQYFVSRVEIGCLKNQQDLERVHGSMKEERYKSAEFGLAFDTKKVFKCAVEVLQADVGDQESTTWEGTAVQDAGFLKIQSVPNLLDINGVDADPTSGNVTLSIIDM